MLYRRFANVISFCQRLIFFSTSFLLAFKYFVMSKVFSSSQKQESPASPASSTFDSISIVCYALLCLSINPLPFATKCIRFKIIIPTETCTSKWKNNIVFQQFEIEKLYHQDKDSRRKREREITTTKN